LQTSSSFRSINKTFKILEKNTNVINQSPSHTTILNWVHKIGLSQLTKEKQKADNWIIILDHSIQIGKEKVLTVLGIRESEVNFTKPLQYQNLYPILEEAREHWDGEGVKEIVEKVQKDLGKIKYAIADYGSDIKKGLKMANIKHVYDLTHKIASLLKKIYKDNEIFISFVKKMGTARIQSQQTVVAHLIPPSMRTKSRFENIGAISDWANKMVIFLRNIPSKDKKNEKLIKEKFGWVLEYEVLIFELNEINQALHEFQKTLKTQGISTKDAKKQISTLGGLNSENGKWIKKQLSQYITETILLIRNTVTSVLCSSDIIESAFGKYKNYVSSNPMAGITNLVLCIAAFTSSLEVTEITQCLEKFTIKDVKDWTKKHLNESLFKKRRESLCPV